ncbi:MAG: hypothetical protein IPJ19_08095 [Planctomycetes bacterium]|nr:hypothetical protein [Planctomycetota bacterium]
MPSPQLLAAGLLLLAPAALSQSTTLFSQTSSGVPGDGLSMLASISGDAHYLSFQSRSDDLLPLDGNGCEDVFRSDRWTAARELVSVSLFGTTGNGPSRQSQISREGRYVCFQSYASDLVPGDTNGESDIFVRDMLLGVTERVSVSSSGSESNGGSRYAYISEDGRFVAFESQASNLVPNDVNGLKDVFLHDRATGKTRILSLASDGSQADDDVLCTSISPDGRYVGFSSTATNLVADDHNDAMDVFVCEVATGTIVRASTNSLGREGHGLSADIDLSRDGHLATFYSLAEDLVPGDSNGVGDVFVKDLTSGVLTRVSVSSSGVQGNWNSYYPRISADGNCVVFFSLADTLVPGDTNWSSDDFLHDLASGTTERVSLAGNGHEARGIARFVSVCDDGRFVAFEDSAPNLAQDDENATWDVFVRDRVGDFHSSCAGDGSQAVPCPCANTGAPGNGCGNSAHPEGARLEALGVAAADDVELVASGMSGLLAVFLQADAQLATPVVFGRGLRCAGGHILRLYDVPSSASAARAPPAGAQSLRERALQLGDAIPPGAFRWYQTWYRDPSGGSCGSSATNLSDALRIQW